MNKGDVLRPNFDTPRRQVGEWLDTVNGFYVGSLVISMYRGASYLSGFLSASIAEQAMPPALRIWCLAQLAIGSAIALVGYLGKHAVAERVGLALLAPAALAYGFLILTQAPRTGSLSFVVYGAIASACVIRFRQIRRARQVTATLMRRIDQ